MKSTASAHDLLYRLVLKMRREGFEPVQYDYWDCGPDRIECWVCGAEMSQRDGPLPEIKDFPHAEDCLWKEILNYLRGE